MLSLCPVKTHLVRRSSRIEEEVLQEPQPQARAAQQLLVLQPSLVMHLILERVPPGFIFEQNSIIFSFYFYLPLAFSLSVPWALVLPQVLAEVPTVLQPLALPLLLASPLGLLLALPSSPQLASAAPSLSFLSLVFANSIQRYGSSAHPSALPSPGDQSLSSQSCIRGRQSWSHLPQQSFRI